MEIAGTRNGRRGAAVAAALLALHVGLALHQAWRQAPTYDEPYYAPSGWQWLAGGTARLNPEHPPAVKTWLGLSWLGAGLPDPRVVPGYGRSDQWTFGPYLLYRDPPRAGWLVFRARAAVVLLSALLGLGVFLAARRAFGELAGLLALALYVLDPLPLAHAGLATLDLGATAAIFAAVTLAWLALDTGRALHLALAAAATGLALAAKGTGVLVVPVLPVLVLAPLLREGGAAPGELRRRAGRALAIAAGGAVALVVACLPQGPSAWWRAIELQREHARIGHASWVDGRQTMACGLGYFPFAWAVKTPLALLAATGAGAILVLLRLRRDPAAAVTILAPPVVLLVGAVSSGICNGIRQVLPATPFLAVAGGGALAALAAAGATARATAWAGRAAVAVLLGWMAVALVRVHPDAIAYSNEVAGGPENTWRLLADSNVDWGQSLTDLGALVERTPVRRIWLDYFGTAWPPAHGLPRFRKVQDHRFRAGAILDSPRRDGLDPAGRELVAVSVTCLVDAYVPETDLHAWLRARTPWQVVGHSIRVYDITDDAVAYRELARMAERMRDPLTAQEANARAEQLEAARRPGVR